MSPAGKRDFEALILAGGRASRMGGIDKASLELDGQRLVDRVVDAARAAGATAVSVIGPPTAGTAADRVLREEPAFAGPLAGIAAGITRVETTWVMVLACDLQYPHAVVAELHRALATAADDGVILIDADGREQWMAGLYRTAALERICRELGERVVNAPVRRALSALELHRRPIGNRESRDIDTPQALEEARAAHARNEEKGN